MSQPKRAKRTVDNGTLTLSLDNYAGTLYDKITQDQAILVSIMNPTPAGWALISIVANGSAITIPSSWKKWGGEDISTTSGQTNHLSVFYKDADNIYYTNMVEL
jgi:hypothetical protein